jgi:hypothetical protein
MLAPLPRTLHAPPSQESGGARPHPRLGREPLRGFASHGAEAGRGVYGRALRRGVPGRAEAQLPVRRPRLAPDAPRDGLVGRAAARACGGKRRACGGKLRA